MKRAKWVIAFLLVVLVGVTVLAVQFRSAPVTKAAGPAPVQPAIECQNTVWRDMVQSSVKSLSDGTNFRAHLYSLRDSVNNAYCGELRVRTAWNMPGGVCHTFTSQLYLSNGTLIGGTTSPTHCGDVSSWDFIKVESSGTYFGLSDCGLFGATQTPNWTIN